MRINPSNAHLLLTEVPGVLSVCGRCRHGLQTVLLLCYNSRCSLSVTDSMLLVTLHLRNTENPLDALFVFMSLVPEVQISDVAHFLRGDKISEKEKLIGKTVVCLCLCVCEQHR